MISNLFKIELIYAHLFTRKSKVAGMITITLNCVVRVLLRNSVSHTYFHVIFRGGRWVERLSTLSFLPGTSIFTQCSKQPCWQCRLQWGSIFSMTVSLVHLLWVFSIAPIIRYMTSPCLQYILLFIPHVPIGYRDRFRYATNTDLHHRVLSYKAFLPILDLVDFRVIFLCSEPSVRPET